VLTKFALVYLRSTSSEHLVAERFCHFDSEWTNIYLVGTCCRCSIVSLHDPNSTVITPAGRPQYPYSVTKRQAPYTHHPDVVGSETSELNKSNGSFRDASISERWRNCNSLIPITVNIQYAFLHSRTMQLPRKQDLSGKQTPTEPRTSKPAERGKMKTRRNQQST
jgi:hypothetical protein